MKKLLYMASFLALVFTSCDPMEDAYDEVDAANAQKVIDAKFFSDKTVIETGYTLTEEDYALSSNETVSSYKNFSGSATVADYLPEILTNKKLYGEAGVEYTVNYNFYRGYSDAFAGYKMKHEVSQAEYDVVNDVVKTLGAYTSNFSASSQIPTLLEAAVSNPVKGDVLRIEALQASKSIDAIKYLVMGADEYTVIIDAVKADDAKKHLVEAKYGTSEYYYGANSYNKNYDARTSKWAAYDAYKNMAENDLKDLIYDRMVESMILVLKNKYPDATIQDASGNEITYVVKYDVYDGSASTKYLRFKCTAEGDALDFARLGSMYINSVYEFYAYDGTSWGVEDTVYRLTSDDYDAMGTDSGYPGKYNNFSTSDEPAHYLPVWLNNTYKYEEDGATKIVAYILYHNAGDKELLASEYTFSKEKGWYLTPTTVVGSSLVAYKDKTWLFVPPIKFVVSEKAATVTFTLSSDDYAFVGNSQYGNFDEDEAVVLEKLAKIIKNNYEVAVGDVYAVTYKYYNGSVNDVTVILEAVEDI
ncbi:hypothetical protein DWB61_00880 [Ancylomarina euxinus]|uniref:Uncharacterized protein n=1 Tax=Ancylomarina euxinus TaxID=2283627 RepID=A0A425Y8E2_9BACT|nr:hypothetical protein [Ancylomarina euxinus]MCZ4693533.1 hypothetical protein [Ancylomarina euxinus]MUP13760.1 hypothetical protein [Ancylomarina euxinus]RRG24602.1 hypothetical protein DWB61_00880 [Ancylomarina euxinus]